MRGIQMIVVETSMSSRQVLLYIEIPLHNLRMVVEGR